MNESQRIDLAQLSFVRAVVQGIPLKEAAHRFLGESMDARMARKELLLIRNELVAAARRAQAWGDARALTIDISQLPVKNTDRCGKVSGKTLEEFRAEVDPMGDFYSEEELLKAYTKEYPADESRYARRIRQLRDRQLRALRVLECVLPQPPGLADPISSWFEESISSRCEAAGLERLQDVLDLMRRRGERWYRAIPRLGERRAQRVQEWMKLNEAYLQTALPLEDEATRESNEALGENRVTIVPLERLIVSEELSGRQGRNRLGAELSGFETDVDAIQGWLEEAGASSSVTQRQYRREAERLLLWSLNEIGKPLSSLDEADMLRYAGFLKNPGKRWINPERCLRSSEHWRPFKQGLSPKSIQYAQRVVGLLFGWLTSKHHLARNVWRNAMRGNARAS